MRRTVAKFLAHAVFKQARTRTDGGTHPANVHSTEDARMKHKNLVRIAIVMVIVFGAIVALYPRLYAPDTNTPIEATPPVPPAAAPITK